MICPVCHSQNSEDIYTGTSGHSISSLAQKIPGKTEVFLCHDCTHAYTKPLENLDDYYNEQYNILVDTEEEDQLFVTKEGKEFYRLEYQADIVETKLDINDSDTILDYGCAKASTLKILKGRHNNIIPMCFDISDAYTKFWDRFVDPKNYFANVKLPKKWNGTIANITSFFSLEHAENPNEFMQDVYRLLKNEGQFLIIVPDFSNNWADLIVADHVNHFTKDSLQTLLNKNNFDIIDIDRDIYHGTFVATAVKRDKLEIKQTKPIDTNTSITKTKDIAHFWKNFSDKIGSIEKNINKQNFVIYGSGFYGAFISTLLSNLPQCYIDQSAHRQGRTFFEKPIVAPEHIPPQTKHLIVGLNPDIAKQVIGTNSSLNLQDISIHYLS